MDALRKAFPQAESARVFPEAIHDGIRSDELFTLEELRIKNSVRNFMVCRECY